MRPKLRFWTPCLSGAAVFALAAAAHANTVSPILGTPNSLSTDAIPTTAWDNWNIDGVNVSNIRTGTSFRTWFVPIHWVRNDVAVTITAPIRNGTTAPTQVLALLTDATGGEIWVSPVVTATSASAFTDANITIPANASARGLTVQYRLGDGQGAAAPISGFPGVATGLDGRFTGAASPVNGKPYTSVGPVFMNNLAMDPTWGWKDWSFGDNILTNNATTGRQWRLPLAWINPFSTTTLSVALQGTATTAQAGWYDSHGVQIAFSGVAHGTTAMSEQTVSVPTIASTSSVLLFYFVQAGGRIGGVGGVPGSAAF